MALAAAILNYYNYMGLFNSFCESVDDLKVLEVNASGNLTKFLKNNAAHRLVQYPGYNMLDLDGPRVRKL